MESADRIREEILVLKAQLGEEEAFVELVRRYQPRLLYYVRRLVRSADLAEDVTQNVWAIVFRKLPRLKVEKAFSVWLYRIARAQAVNMIREESHYAELPGDYDAAEDSGIEEGAEDEEVFSPLAAARIHRALELLTPEHREALTLRFMENMSYEAISEIVGCRPGTVKSRIYYAKRALRKEMEALRNE
jgi:RNA polymerase sigma-70 factor (ECF subfamily)